MTGYLTIILYWRNKTKQNRSPSVFNIQAPTNPLSGARGLPEKIALESNILNRGRGVNMHYMYTLLCIRYKDHHSVLHHAFHYVNSLKVCIPHCSSTTATSRKQVTNRLYVAVFCLILLPQVIYMKVAIHDTYEE